MIDQWANTVIPSGHIRRVSPWEDHPSKTFHFHRKYITDRITCAKLKHMDAERDGLDASVGRSLCEIRKVFNDGGRGD